VTEASCAPLPDPRAGRAPATGSRREDVLAVVRAYDRGIVRLYCWARFGILRQRFLDEIGQYLPLRGAILDVGCGFGLFSLYYARLAPERRLHGLDLNPRRIDLARRAARRLGLANVRYEVGDACAFDGRGPYAAAYMLDIVHHVPPEAVPPLLARLHEALVPGGMLLVKDVDTRPTYKRRFTWALDRLLDPRSPVRYWPAEDLTEALEDAGFLVRRHLLVDFLPYPHVLYICQAGARGRAG
jgi:SAM-dependent methyltransferase